MERKFPHQNKTCASEAEMEEMSKHVMLMLVTMSQYFDENEFEVSPVKTEIKT